MNIGKPTNFKHILHAGLNRYSRSGEVQCIGNGNEDAGSGSGLNISSPTGFQHNLHMTRDSRTGEVAVCTPEEEKLCIDSNCNDDTSYECNNCNELYQQWRQDQIKIKELQEENHSMMAMAARLYVFVTRDIYNNPGETELLGSTNLKEFNESMQMIARTVNDFKHDILWFNRTIEVMKETRREMESDIATLKYVLNKKDKKLYETDERIRRNEVQFNLRVEAADRELKLLKLEINDLRRENEHLYHNLGNARLLFTEWQDTSSSVSSALGQEMTVTDLKKENELLKKDMTKLSEDSTKLHGDVIATMNKLLKPTDTRRNSSGSLGKHVNYNIQAKSVHFMEKSNVTCEKSSNSDDLQDILQI